MERSTTEAEIGITPDAAALLSIGYLKRNGFKQLCQTRQRLISAKDGTRPVLVWVDLCLAADRPAISFVPLEVVSMARESSSRLDVIKYATDGEKVSLSHTMNVLVDP